MCFLPLYGFICEILDFPSVKSSKIFTAHRILQDTNFKYGKVGFIEARFSIFCKSKSFTAAKKTGLIDFTEKRAPT